MSGVVLTYNSGGGSEAVLWNVIVRLDMFQGRCKCTSICMGLVDKTILGRVC